MMSHENETDTNPENQEAPKTETDAPITDTSQIEASHENTEEPSKSEEQPAEEKSLEEAPAEVVEE
ncbi:MAG: hypothetical protein ACPH3K_02990, partial [Candidatus Micropelagos thuwalensis]